MLTHVGAATAATAAAAAASRSNTLLAPRIIRVFGACSAVSQRPGRGWRWWDRPPTTSSASSSNLLTPLSSLQNFASASFVTISNPSSSAAADVPKTRKPRKPRVKVAATATPIPADTSHTFSASSIDSLYVSSRSVAPTSSSAAKPSPLPRAVLTRPVLYTIDVMSVMYRSYFAHIARPLRATKTGLNTSGLYGIIQRIVRLLVPELYANSSFVDARSSPKSSGVGASLPLQQLVPDYLAVTSDLSGRNFRHTLYPPYKEQRGKMPKDVMDSWPYLARIMASLHLPLFTVPGFEADDIIATLHQMWVGQRQTGDGAPAGTGAEDAGGAGTPSMVICTQDKDLMQLVDACTFVERGTTEELMTIDHVKERWGVPPNQLGDVFALMGDDTDNIPGVTGVGEKTAVKLIQQYGSLDAVYASLDKISASTRTKLVTDRANAFLSRQLVTMDRHVSLPAGFTLDHCRVGLTAAERAALPSLHWDRSKATARTETTIVTPTKAVGVVTSPPARSGPEIGLPFNIYAPSASSHPGPSPFAPTLLPAASAPLSLSHNAAFLSILEELEMYNLISKLTKKPHPNLSIGANSGGWVNRRPLSSGPPPTVTMFVNSWPDAGTTSSNTPTEDISTSPHTSVDQDEHQYDYHDEGTNEPPFSPRSPSITIKPAIGPKVTLTAAPVNGSGVRPSAGRLSDRELDMVTSEKRRIARELLRNGVPPETIATSMKFDDLQDVVQMQQQLHEQDLTTTESIEPEMMSGSSSLVTTSTVSDTMKSVNTNTNKKKTGSNKLTPVTSPDTNPFVSSHVPDEDFTSKASPRADHYWFGNLRSTNLYDSLYSRPQTQP